MIDAARQLSGVTRLAAIAFVGAWAVTLPILAAQSSTDPIGRNYDTANRIFTLALVAAVVLFVAIRRELRGRGGLAPTVAVVTSGLVLAGNALEFWGGLLQDAPLSATAERLGQEHYWVGSDIGFALFAIGMLGLTVASITLGVRAARRDLLPKVAAAAVAASGVGTLVAFAAVDMGVAAAVLVAIALSALWAAALALPTRVRAASLSAT